MIRFYLDHHVPRAVANGLRLRGIDVLTAQEDGASELSDPELLNRATALGRVLFSQDDDLLTEVAKRRSRNENLAGVIYAHQLNITIGRCVEDLEIIARACEPHELEDQVIFLPL